MSERGWGAAGNYATEEPHILILCRVCSHTTSHHASPSSSLARNSCIATSLLSFPIFVSLTLSTSPRSDSRSPCIIACAARKRARSPFIQEVSRAPFDGHARQREEQEIPLDGKSRGARFDGRPLGDVKIPIPNLRKRGSSWPAVFGPV